MSARWLFVVVVALAAPRLAHAQKAEAAVAFERGRTLMAAGRTAEACAAFETSMRLDPQKGTLYNLGLCHEKLGKLASAWAELGELAATDTNAGRAKDAKQRAAALERRLTRMRLTTLATDPGLVVLRDKIDVTALVGQESPVDPGHYTFEARAPGHEPVTLAVDLIGEGKTIEVAIPAFPSTAAVAPSAAPTGYPLLVPLRPLVLPRGTFEIQSYAAMFDAPLVLRDPIDGNVTARFGLGRIELQLGFSVHLQYPVDMYRTDAISAIGGAARYAITPMFVGSLEYTDLQPTGGPAGTGSDLRAVVARKWLVHPQIAIEGRGGLLFSQRKIGDTNPDELALVGEGYAQAAATSRLSFQGIASMKLNFGGSLYNDTTFLTVGAEALLAVDAHIDVFVQAYTGLAPNTDIQTYLLGAAWRTR